MGIVRGWAVAVGLLASGLAQVQGTARAQDAADYPNKTIRVLVPYGPGGATDIVARVLGEQLTATFKQPVVVENKPGGNGIVAIQDVARAKPDGYTLLIGNVTTNAINPIIVGAEMPVDPTKALVPVSRLVEVPAILMATNVNFPPKTVAEAVAYAKARPTEINHNSAGYLSYSHLDFIQLQKRAGIELTLIPLKAGAGGGQIDLINGEVHLALQNAATVLPMVQAGKLKALAVTGERRLPALPDVPTFAEAGYPGLGTDAWQAIYAPAATPGPVLEKLHAALARILASDAAKAKFDELTITVKASPTLADAAAWQAGEMTRWRPIVTEAKTLAKP